MASTRTNQIGTEDPHLQRGHVLKPNGALSGLRVLQLLLAIVILGLAGYVVTFISYSGAGLELFSASATILIILYILLSTHHFTSIYSYWAIGCLDIFLVIFWFISFIVTSYQVARTRHNRYWYCGAVFCNWVRRDLLELEVRDDDDGVLFARGWGGEGQLMKRATTSYGKFRAVMIAAAVLGAVEFILFILTFGMTLKQAHHHRGRGGHSTASAKKQHRYPDQHDVEMQPAAQEFFGGRNDASHHQHGSEMEPPREMGGLAHTNHHGQEMQPGHFGGAGNTNGLAVPPQEGHGP